MKPLSSQLSKFTFLSGLFLTLFLAPHALGADFFYVGNWGNNTITKFDSSGNGTLFASTGLSQPQGLAFDASGSLFVGNSGNNTIMKFDSTGHGTFFANSGSP